MASTSTYLNFPRETETAFNFYKSVFKTEFTKDLMRFGEVPPQPGQPAVVDADKNLIMHIALPITGGHIIHGTDAPESMGFRVIAGNNVYIMIQPDTKHAADELFTALSVGGKIEMPMTDQFWGDYFGSLTDKFGINWMINCPNK